MGFTGSEKQDFHRSGPFLLASSTIDWTKEDHKRSVVASLVRGAYVLERDRQKKRQGSQALASPWWESFHFRLQNQLIDEADSSIFCAIYEYEPPGSHGKPSTAGVPRYVFAFRGNQLKRKTIVEDIKLDLHLIRNKLHRKYRFEIAMQAVRNMVASVGNSNVWLAGHSLGAAMAMLAGKTMAKMGIFLEAFLFNPPFPSAPIESLKNEKVKQALRMAGDVTRAGFALAVDIIHPNTLSATEDAFAALSAWVPRLYVNQADHFFSEYIGYFENRRKMEEIGFGGIGRLGTQHSLRDVLKNPRERESEPPRLHLIPSAILTINKTPYEICKQAHGIDQWWKPDQQLQDKHYTYK